MWHRLLIKEAVRLTVVAAALIPALAPADVAAQLTIPGADGADAAGPGADDSDGLRGRDPQLLTSGEMKSLAVKYSYDIVTAVAKVRAARVSAQMTRDAIKVSCIDQILPEMKMIDEALVGRFGAISRRTEEFAVRAEFIVISPGWQRVNELRQEAEECTGESMDSSRVDSTKSDTPPSTGTDPSEPATRPGIAERPTEASRFR